MPLYLVQDTSLPELQRGLLALRQQLGEHTMQLKSLVKENFDRFISSKNTIDTVYAKLQRAEAEGEAGVNGASTGEVLEAVQQVGAVFVWRVGGVGWASVWLL
jgi:exocyst complex component 2